MKYQISSRSHELLSSSPKGLVHTFPHLSVVRSTYEYFFRFPIIISRDAEFQLTH